MSKKYSAICQFVDIAINNNANANSTQKFSKQKKNKNVSIIGLVIN